MEFVIVGALVIAMIYVMKKKADADQAARDSAFEATMRSLEEKAKREGTFKMSYFDKSEK